MFTKAKFNLDHALGFTGIGLPVENTLISLRRLHSLAFGFETGPGFLASTVFQGNPIPVLTKYLGLTYRFTGTKIYLPPRELSVTMV